MSSVEELRKALGGVHPSAADKVKDHLDPHTTTFIKYDATIDAQNTFDLHYQYAFMNEAACVTVSAINFTDEEPPLARLDLNYDAYTHNAFGRMIKIGIEYTFADD